MRASESPRPAPQRLLAERFAGVLHPPPADVANRVTDSVVRGVVFGHRVDTHNDTHTSAEKHVRIAATTNARRASKKYSPTKQTIVFIGRPASEEPRILGGVGGLALAGLRLLLRFDAQCAFRQSPTRLEPARLIPKAAAPQDECPWEEARPAGTDLLDAKQLRGE